MKKRMGMKKFMEAKELGENARQTILEKFNEDSFVGNWNNIFNKAYGLKK